MFANRFDFRKKLVVCVILQDVEVLMRALYNPKEDL
jgi:hypothetical protein